MQGIALARRLATRAQEGALVDTAGPLVAAPVQHGFVLNMPLPSRDTSDVGGRR